MEESKIKALISLLDDDDVEVVSQVEKEFLAQGGSIIPYLEKEWEQNFNPVVQKRIEDLVHILQFVLLEDRFSKWKKTGGEDLMEGLWLICTYQYPDLEFSTIKNAMEQIYYEVWLEMKPDMLPMEQVRTLNNVLFTKLKFSSNTKNFHSPANSMISQVLESKKGNPISLCVIYMMVAQKLKLPIYGVNLPSLFILTYKNDHSQFYINAFNKGLIFTKEDIDNYLHQLNLTPMDVFYQPCSNIDIVARVLRNLINSFEKLSEMDRVEDVKKMLHFLTGEKY
ncbi:MAG TPA: transglutaminase-like domain-containing protein [Cytophaga sp.]|nr:transglutaminase-like domain-containing protein [Cytophaga sp.]